MYFKTLAFDIKNGILKNKFLVCFSFILPLLFCIDFLIKIHNKGLENYSYSDFLMYIYGGMKEYIPSPENPFGIPALWIILFSILFFGSLNYPYNDLNGIGKQILIRTQGRKLWWISKCTWNIIYTLIYHLIIWAIVAIFALFSNSSFSEPVNIDITTSLFDIYVLETIQHDADIYLNVFLVPVFISISLGLLQMTLSLFIKPIFSFISIGVILVSSSYLMSNLFIGNFMMIIRTNIFMKNGLNMQNGIIFASIIAIVSVLVGMFKFNRYDIINNEE